MNTKILLTLGVCAVLFSACGGGDTMTDVSKSAALNACDPVSGPAGTLVVCSDASITEDMTLFFGGKPVDFTLGEDGSASFVVPPALPGEKSIDGQAGSDDKITFGTFEVEGAASDEVNPSDSGTPAGATTGDSGAEVIEPSGTTGGSTTGDGTTTGGEGSTGSGTGGETTGGTPPVEAAPATIDTFKVEKVTGTALFSTYKVTYAFSGKAAYFSGNLFNRKPGDGDLSASQRCKVQDGNRYLVTNADGNNLNAGSANFAKYEHLSEGKLCDNTNAATEDDCKTSSSSSNTAQVTSIGDWKYAEVDSAVSQVDFSNFKLIQLEKNPSCRVDLVKDGVLQTSGEFATRSLAEYGQICLAVQGENGAWIVQCKTMEAPKPSVNAPSVTVSASKPAFTLKFGFSNGTGVSVVGCATKSNVALANGTGSYEGECAINAEDKQVNVTLQGIGEKNQTKRKYDVALGTPSVSFKLYGVEPLDSAAADFKFAFEATRTYAISDDDGAVANGSAPWLKDYVFSGFSSGDGTFPVTSPSDVKGVKSAHRDFSHTSWTFKVHDFAGNVYSSTWSKTYPKDFSLLVSGGVSGGMDAYSLQHCNDTPNLRIHMDLPWSGHGIASITSSDCSVESGSSDLADMGQYGGQAGHIYVYKDFGAQDSTWDKSLSCDFKIKYYDGSESTRSFTMTGVSCH